MVHRSNWGGAGGGGWVTWCCFVRRGRDVSFFVNDERLEGHTQHGIPDHGPDIGNGRGLVFVAAVAALPSCGCQRLAIIIVLVFGHGTHALAAGVSACRRPPLRVPATPTARRATAATVTFWGREGLEQEKTKSVESAGRELRSMFASSHVKPDFLTWIQRRPRPLLPLPTVTSRPRGRVRGPRLAR